MMSVTDYFLDLLTLINLTNMVGFVSFISLELLSSSIYRDELCHETVDAIVIVVPFSAPSIRNKHC